LNNIIDFKWDKAAFFGISCSAETISNVLDIAYEESYDFKFGMVFTYQGHIVYKELIMSEIEKQNKFWIHIGENSMDTELCILVTQDNSSITASRENINSQYYYTIYFEYPNATE
jgi:hypothetical protein